MVFTAGRGLIRSLPEKWKFKKTSWKSFSEVGIGTGIWATLFGVDFTSLIGTHFVFGSQRFKASGLVRKWKKIITCTIIVVNLWQGYNWLNCFSMYWTNSLREAFLSKIHRGSNSNRLPFSHPENLFLLLNWLFANKILLDIIIK